MSIEDESPNIIFVPDAFPSKGFTQSGEKRFRQAVKDYSDELFKASVSLAVLTKELGSNLEITNDLVKDAVRSLVARHAQRPRTTLNLIAHVFEYIFTLSAGVGASNIAHAWGVFLIVGSAIAWVLLFVYRNSRK